MAAAFGLCMLEGRLDKCFSIILDARDRGLVPGVLVGEIVGGGEVSCGL